MNIVVCVKQIPVASEPGALDPDTNTLRRDGAIELDESDGYGVEMALQLVEAAGGGEVTLVSMAPESEVKGIRTALAMGAAKAVLVSDPALAGSDALGTAKVLAQAIRWTPPSPESGEVSSEDDEDSAVGDPLADEESSGSEAAQAVEPWPFPDLVLTATESSDGYTGTLPEQLAGLLDIPSITFAKHIEVRDGKALVQRQTEAGYDEVECPLPALVSVTAGVVEVRYPSFKGIMAAKAKPVHEANIADLGIDAGSVGWAGGQQEIVDVSAAEAREAGEIITDEGEAHLNIVAFLDQLKVL